MKKLSLLALFAITHLVLNSATAQVSVWVENQQHQFANEPRLLEVLAPLGAKEKVYWPGTALYEIDKGDLEQTRQALLKRLSALAKAQLQKAPQLSYALEQLVADITSWTLARRLPVIIDYDLARIEAAANPQFTQGHYRLRLAPRPKVVHVFGAVNYSQQVAHLPHSEVSQYNTRQHHNDLANKELVHIIQADGREIKAPSAYWNKSHQEVMPGSQIFVPFKESLFSPEFSQINQQIVTLAVNRVL